MAEYNTPEDYQEIIENVGAVPDTCGCAVIGLISVTDCSGNVVGLLTPNDAEIYKNGTLEVPVGYVKVFHPVTGQYLGIMTHVEAQEYIEFLLTTVAP